MAKSGRITITQGTQEKTNNRTYITVTGVIVTSGESYRGNQNTGTVTVTQNGVAIHSSTFTHGAPANSTTTLFNIGLWVYHDSNGNSGTISASYNYDGGWCTANASTTLTTIQRRAEILSAPDFTNSDNPIIKYSNPDGFRVNIWLEINPVGEHLCIRENIGNGGNYTYELTDSEREALIRCCTNDTATVRFGMYTYNGSTLIGTHYVDKTFTLTKDIIPTANVTLSDAEGHFDKYGKYIQGKSKLQVSIDAEGVYGSTIKSYKTTFDGKTYTDANFTTDVITGKDELELEVVVTDSRDRSFVVKESIEVYEYTLPKILSAKAKRCQQHNVNEIGEKYMGIVFTSSVTPLGDNNSALYEVFYKRIKDPDYEAPMVLDYNNRYSLSEGYAIFAADNDAYNIILRITDDFGSVEKKINGPSISVLVSKLKYNLGIAFGKLAEIEGVCDIGFKTRFFGGILYKVLETETNADEILTPNRYLVKAKNTHTGFPESGVEAVLDVVGDNEIIKQTFSVIDKTNQRTYERVYTYAEETWSNWICLCGDFIVEQGTSGIWIYRKWNSGKAELWGKYAVSNFNVATAWGSLYEAPINLPDFPFAFTDIPYAHYTWQAAPSESGTAVFIEYAKPTETSAGSTFLCRPTALTVNGYIVMYCIGDWK